MVKRFVLKMILALLLILNSGPSLAQTEADSSVDLPAADILGEGWLQYGTAQPTELLTNVFLPNGTDWIQDGSVGLYSGSDAARIVVVRITVDQETYGSQGGWVAAQDLIMVIGLSVEPDIQESISSSSRGAPRGCQEAERLEGTESLYQLPFGVTMCSQEDASVLVVIVSGEWNGMTGTEASDHLIQLVAEQR